MTAFSLTKVGRIGSRTGPFYYPCAIDTSDVPNWPWTVTVYSSTDHGTGGISMFGAVGDPTVPANWESYDTARAAGRFDSFATKPAGNPIYIDPDTNDAETPHIVKVGSSWYLTSHDEITATYQPTRLAIATDAPLNFARYSANSGVVLSVSTSPNSEYPKGASSGSGYFRWGANPFPGIAYAYIGYGLWGGGDATHYALSGSDDGVVWDLIRILDANQFSGLPTSPSPWMVKFPEIDPQSIRDAGNGEYVALCACGNPASGAATRYSELYEVYLAADGYTITREPRLLLSRGGAGAYDEYEIGQPSSLIYSGTLVCVYQGADSAGANSLMIAVGSVDAAAAKPDQVSLPNHDKYDYDATGSAALPSWLVADGTAPTPTSTGLSIPSGNAGGVKLNWDINPATTSWVDLYTEWAYQSAISNIIPRLQITDTGPATGNNGVVGISFASAGGTGAGLTQLIGRASSASVNLATINYAWNSDPGKRHKAGIRADFANRKLSFVGNGRLVRDVLAVPDASLPSALRPRISNGSSVALIVERIILRMTPTGAGIAPTITTASADATTVSLALSESCIGDGTGLIVKANGTAVSGVWSRSSLTALVFTRSAGEFVSTDTITLDVESTDIRNVADLVAVQDVAAASVTNTVEPSGPITETLDTLITSISSVADQQAYRDTVDTLITSGATVEAVTEMVEALLSLGVSASTAADVQGYADGVNDTIVSASDTADAQNYVDGPATTGVSSSDETDTQAYTDSLADTLVSASDVTDTTGTPPITESLLTTAVSASNVSAAQAYVETVTALAVSASSLGEVLGLVEQIGTVGESVSAVSDRQLYYDNVAIVALSSSSLAEVGAYIEQVAAAAVSASSLTDVLVGSFVGRYVFAGYCRPRSFADYARARSFEDYCRPRGRRLQ